MTYTLAEDALKELLAAAGRASWQPNSARFTGDPCVIRTPYQVESIGAASYAGVGLAVDTLWQLRGHRPQEVAVDLGHAGFALRANRYLTIADRSPGLDFRDQETGIYATADGRWVYLHCNFSNIRDANLACLGLRVGEGGIAEKVAQWQAQQLEDAIFGNGGCGGMVRSMEEWRCHPQAQAVAAQALLSLEKIGEAPPKALPDQAVRPLSGIRVLDLTRVIAGPTCTRVLAEHGADVLKITRADLPASGMLDVETGIGKRSVHLDLRKADEMEALRSLATAADVFCQAYRPGTLAKRGFSPRDMAELRPGIVYASLDAWGGEGPWRARRGYDTVVQTMNGMAHTQGGNAKPVHLPVSAIDYIAGNVMAMGVMQALALRATQGGSWHVRVSLARIGQWVIDAGLRSPQEYADVPADMSVDELAALCGHMDSSMGHIRYLKPILQLSETPPRLELPPVPLGYSSPRWQG